MRKLEQTNQEILVEPGLQGLKDKSLLGCLIPQIFFISKKNFFRRHQK